MSREAAEIEAAISDLKGQYGGGSQQHREAAIKTVDLRLSTFAQAVESMVHTFEEAPVRFEERYCAGRVIGRGALFPCGVATIRSVGSDNGAASSDREQQSASSST